MTYPAVLSSAIDRACAGFEDRLDRLPPALATRTRGWLAAFTKGHTLADALRGPGSFPMALFPWWLDETLVTTPPATDHEVLARSCVAAYLFIRMVDDVVDDDGAADRALLPVVGVFHQEFQSSLLRLLPADAPFWVFFEQTWDRSAAVTVADAEAKTIDEASFRDGAGLKSVGAAIQVAAVCELRGRPDLRGPWAALVEAFSRWHQFGHDLFDWAKDDKHGTVTYLTSEASRRRAEGETTTGWMFREGFAWGRTGLSRLMDEVRVAAGPLGSKPLLAYLDTRQAEADGRLAEIEAGLKAARALFAASPSQG